jgi:hypothetical protein
MPHGKWNITLKTPVGDKAGVLDFTVDGDKLTGSLSHAEHFAAISDGKIIGDKLSWSAKITKPMRMNVKFTATIDADRIRGDAKHLFGTLSFSGTRA